MKKLAVFASGSGTNAENIIRYFSGSPLARVALVVSDNPDAYALQRAASLGVPTVVFPRAEFRTAPENVVRYLSRYGIDYIVLAGFLSLVPSLLCREYEGRMVNVHPALLPAYGGKGMYGDRVHRAVVENGERESGITIHHVNEVYDSGDTIAQFRVAVDPSDTAESLAAKIHELEYRHFPEVIESELRKPVKKKESSPEM